MSNEWVAEIDPSIVYFTFSRIRPFFSCGRTVHDTLEQLCSRRLAIDDLPSITLLFDGRNYFSLNNRRLYCMKELRKMGLIASMKARVKPVPNSKRMVEKYTPEKCSLTATLMRESGAPKTAGDKVDDDDADEDEVKKEPVEQLKEDPSGPPTDAGKVVTSDDNATSPTAAVAKATAKNESSNGKRTTPAACSKVRSLAQDLADLGQGAGDTDDDDDDMRQKGKAKKGKRKNNK